MIIDYSPYYTSIIGDYTNYRGSMVDRIGKQIQFGNPYQSTATKGGHRILNTAHLEILLTDGKTQSAQAQ